jgi:NADPH:quinone reductase-like Zn-dependent oxidoreductase
MGEPRNRVIHVTRFGDPDEFEVVDASLPTVGQGEVRIRVRCSHSADPRARRDAD